MKVKLTKYFAVMLVFIIIPYFIDQIDGFVNLVLMKDWPIAKFYKTPILLYAMGYTFLYDKTKKYTIMLLIFLTLFIISTLVNIHDQYSELSVISMDLGYLLKIFSMPIYYFYFVVFHRNNSFPPPDFIKKVFLFIFSAFGLAIFLSYFGFGLSFYGLDQEGESIGQQGYFTAGNEISGFFILLANLFYFYALKLKKVLFMFGSLCIVISIGLLMGSKTAMISTLICFIGVFFLIKKYDKKLFVLTKLDSSLIFTFSLLIMLGIVFISQIIDFMQPTIHYFSYRYKVSNDLLKFLTSGRLYRADVVLNNYSNNFTFIHMLFGEGYTFSKTLHIATTRYSKAEMDFPDFLSIIGIVGATMIYAFWFYIWAKVYQAYRNRKNELAVPLVFALGILIINSNISGHIIYSGIINPSLAYLAAYVLKSNWNEDKENTNLSVKRTLTS